MLAEGWHTELESGGRFQGSAEVKAPVTSNPDEGEFAGIVWIFVLIHVSKSADIHEM